MPSHDDEEELGARCNRCAFISCIDLQARREAAIAYVSGSGDADVVSQACIENHAWKVYYWFDLCAMIYQSARAVNGAQRSSISPDVACGIVHGNQRPAYNARLM